MVLPLLLTLTSGGYGQRIWFGIVGGTNLTNNFPLTQQQGGADPFGNPAYLFRYETGSRSLILGASLEAGLTNSLSVEANILHRPMKSKLTFRTFPVGAPEEKWTYEVTAVRAWEFPILLKYTAPVSLFGGRLRPFVTAGPSFRTQEDVAATEPSQVGISAGGGAVLRLGHFRISSGVRYTRWAREDVYPRYATKPDQLEFLSGLAFETDSTRRPLAGRRVEFGAIAGVATTKGFKPYGDGSTTDERIGYLVGVTTQMPVKGGLAVEVDVIYKPIRAQGESASRRTSFSVLTWQFPVLAKYTWAQPTWKPFVAAGPSFRLSGNLNGYNPSHYGITAGGGVERRWGLGPRISTGARYTRWAGDAPPFSQGVSRWFDYSRTNPNSVELVFGISF